jgi:hypothetical protein
MEKWLNPSKAVVVFIIVTLLGSGALWEWQKHKLDAITTATDLWKQENDLYAKIIDLSNQYIETQNKYYKTPSNELHNKMVQQTSQLELMKDNFTALEAKLAPLEDRPPRNIQLQFIPPSAPQLTVTAQ